ncbi:hypothetical protein [Dyadobacter tibetensis]|uniref:hypothetical protein n=1 Tax=Dyadobacter tibetensis TaxID=1211851 RepID=UPI0006943781|nr:hypothetical protein [Dyadobacter tibetensis]
MNLSKHSVQHILPYFLSLSIFALYSCDNGKDPDVATTDDFQTVPTSFPIAAGIIDEASGIAPAQYLNDYLWSVEDSGGPNAIFLVAKNGSSITPYTIPGSSNVDWEDIASGKGPDATKNYVYIADIGNNGGVDRNNTIYRVPDLQVVGGSFAADAVEKIQFRYPDGNLNAEALLLDPLTLDLIIISKEADRAGIYRLPYPQSTVNVITAEKVGNIPSLNLVTGGDVSVKGDEVLIRTYLTVSYWRLSSGQSVAQALTTPAKRSFLIAPEPQGEGICFDKDLKGYYTLSELGNASSVSLNYFKRK